MPNIKSAKKRVLTSAKKHDSNKANKTELKTVIKKARAKDANSEAVASAVKFLDKAAAKGLVHKNKAARLKSGLAKKQNASA